MQVRRRLIAQTGEFLLPGGAAFVVPHAGLVYSGTVALAAYRHLEQQPPETVVILGFAHRGSRPGIWIPEVDQISTPLGSVAIDHSLGNRLLESQAFQRAPEAQLCDHSVEIQLPLIQKVAPKARVLPLYAGSMDSRTRRRAAEALAPLIGNGTVLVASSDLTHYGRDFRFQPFPADSHTAEHLRELDTSVMNAAGSLDAPFFLSTLEETGATVCGRSPISLLLETLSLTQGEEFFQEILDYQTSGEITGEVHHSVSYGALGYFPAPAFHLDRAEQKLLLGSARGTLERYQKTGKRLRVPPEVRTPALMRKAAAFVSLHRRGELRGCVGHRAAFQPLFDAIPELTLSAAIDDSRFEAVAGDEQDIDIEISVLSPMKRIASPGLFQVGHYTRPSHGIVGASLSGLFAARAILSRMKR